MEDKKNEILKKEIYQVIFNINNGRNTDEDESRSYAAGQIVKIFNRELDFCLAEGSASGWVSVKDRLPEDGVPVFVYTKGGAYKISEYDAQEKCFYTHFIKQPAVTHWSLPLPPGQLDKEDGRATKI